MARKATKISYTRYAAFDHVIYIYIYIYTFSRIASCLALLYFHAKNMVIQSDTIVGASVLIGSSHMVIVRLVFQPSLLGIGCRRILEMRRLLNFFNLF